ncbi:hypothetical protein GW17_00057014 [Ensete ventricosum]|nr:hypothetical protein GW17_00057014 [Ensete ventricosum]
MRRSPDLSKEELGESSTGGSPFIPEVLDKSIPHNFRLLTLEAYDGSSDLTEHIMAFRAQMALYETIRVEFPSQRSIKIDVASLFGTSQKDDEPLAQFITCLAVEIRGMPNAHLSLVFQAFLIGLRPSRFFLSLVECPPLTVPKMLQRANQYVNAEALVAGKREDQKRPRVKLSRVPPPGSSRRRMARPELATPLPR